jgi:hypothetical protein
LIRSCSRRIEPVVATAILTALNFNFPRARGTRPVISAGFEIGGAKRLRDASSTQQGGKMLAKCTRFDFEAWCLKAQLRPCLFGHRFWVGSAKSMHIEGYKYGSGVR